MSGMNKAIIIGNVGEDPKVRPAGESSVANFSVATSEKFEKNGEKHERTEWHRCVAWGKLADIVGQYVKKGSQIAVEGKIQTRSYEKDGQTRYSTEIVASSVVLLGSRKQEQRPAQQRGARPDPDPNNGAEIDEISF